MATQNVARPTSQIPSKTITYSAREVALMARFANDFSPELALALGFSRDHLGVYVEDLAKNPSPSIPPCIARFFNLRPDRKGGYQWNPAQ
jgi:hypothetical protein